MGKIKGGTVVRLLKAAPDRTMLVKHLRKALAGSELDGDIVKQELKQVLAKLLSKGRISKNGSDVTLLKKTKEQEQRRHAAANSDDDAGDGENAEVDGSEEQPAEYQAGGEATWAGEEQWAGAGAAAGAGSAEPEHYDNPTGCTRVFLGNLSFDIEEEDLKAAIPGITHIKWITDKIKRTFCGTVFIEVATPWEAAGAVDLGGQPSPLCKLGRLKANYAPARPQDVWPPYGPSSKPLGPDALAAEACQRVFLGNLPYKIDEATLHNCIPGITDVTWITDRWTGDFYGTAFAEFESLDAAKACVAMVGTPVGPKGGPKRPLKANFAPPKPAPDRPPPDDWNPSVMF